MSGSSLRASRPVADAVMSALARVLVRVFFSDLEVTGASSVPAEGPVLVVANHHNGLVDGLVLLAALPRYPRFLGKSTLWRVLPLRPFLALAGAVPVHRAADRDLERAAPPAGAATTGPAGPPATGPAPGNDDAFARCRSLLAAGGLVAVFPEGVSHDEPHLQSLRTGAARIALGAAGEDGVTGLSVVAAGLVYDDKAIFRSRALVRFGPPHPVDPVVEAWRADPPAGVRALTARMADDLRAVAPDFAGADEAARCLAVADLVVGRSGTAGDLAERERVAEELARRAEEPDGPDGFGRLWAEAQAYRHDLAVAGLDDETVTAGASAVRWRAELVRSGAKVALAAPVSVVGVGVHALPYGIIRAVGSRSANVGMRATVKLLGCFGLFGLTYAALAVAVGLRRGPRAGLAVLVGAPISGWVALRSSERLARMGGAARTLDALRHHRATRAALAARRAAVVAEAERFLRH
jgi:glycerol-3-phosphate O-acyltransferase/dihydroxyacetone phosphate acyltransferase